MAQNLAQDLQEFAPDHIFVIYSDRPHTFKGNPNVLAVKHICRGVQSYHERRFAIWHALFISSSVMYLDADVRICAPLPTDLKFNPGLTARSCGNLQKHLKSQIDKDPNCPKRQRKQYIVRSMAAHAEIDIDLPELKFINEFLFVVTKDNGKERDFLRYWGELAIFADTLGMHKHPTYAMAFAAEKGKLEIHHSNMVGLDFFDDRIERERIKKGKSSPEKKLKYFQQQNKIEQRDINIFRKSLRVIFNLIQLEFNKIRVKVLSRLSLGSLVKYPENFEL